LGGAVSQGHLVVEALLVVVISALLFQRSYKPVSRKDEDLTDKASALVTKVLKNVFSGASDLCLILSKINVYCDNFVAGSRETLVFQLRLKL